MAKKVQSLILTLLFVCVRVEQWWLKRVLYRVVFFMLSLATNYITTIEKPFALMSFDIRGPTEDWSSEIIPHINQPFVFWTRCDKLKLVQVYYRKSHQDWKVHVYRQPACIQYNIGAKSTYLGSKKYEQCSPTPKGNNEFINLFGCEYLDIFDMYVGNWLIYMLAYGLKIRK